MDEAEQRWARVRGALHSEVARVAELLRSIEPAGGGAWRLGSWDAGDVAVHLSQVWLALPALAGTDTAGSPLGSFDELGAFTRAGVRDDPERDLDVIAARIETAAADHLARARADEAHEHRPWLVDGVRVPVPTFSAHLLNETVVHGEDIARAAGRPWRIDPVHAALVVDEFLMAVLAAAGGVLPGRRPPDRRIAGLCEVRVRGGRRHRVRIGEGAAGVDRGSDGHPDCRLSVDPVTMLQLFYGRRSLAAAALGGGLAVWGRRPWLAAALLGTMPSP